MAKFEMVEKRAEAIGARAFWRAAIKKYEAAKAALEAAAAELERREAEYLAVEKFA